MEFTSLRLLVFTKKENCGGRKGGLTTYIIIKLVQVEDVLKYGNSYGM